MAANAIDLTTAAIVADALGLASSSAVERAVTAASRAIASYCGRTFEKGAAIVEYPEGYGRPLLLLDRAPVVSIASITELGATVAAADYECVGKNAAAGLVYRLRGVWMRTGRSEGLVTEGSFAYQGSTEGIVATYTAGWVTPGQFALDPQLTLNLPEDVQEAALLAAVAFYRRRGVDPSLASEAIGDWSASYRATDPQAPVPPAAMDLLAPYVRYRAS